MKKSDVIDIFSKFVSIQSVSADSKRSKEIQRAVEFLKSRLIPLGFKVETIRSESAPPLVLASKVVNSNAKTIAVYGHYDVQPEDPIKEWKTPPFTLTVKDGKMYGRGVADSKGHVIQNIASVSQLIESKRLKNNILFIFEGEEETASKHFEGYVNKIKHILSKADVFYVVDMGMYKNIPQIYYGLRGLVYFELEIEIGKRDLHSGIYGNRVYNPAQEVANLFSKMKNKKTNLVTIPGFYDNVRKITAKERTLLSKIVKTKEEQKKVAGVYEIIFVNKEEPQLSSKIYPSLDINGMISGYTGEGEKTIIPRKALVKFSCRLVEFQNPDDVEKKVKAFIVKNIPKGIKYTLRTLSRFPPFYSDINNRYTQNTAKILSEAFGHETLFNRSGGSVGAAEVMQRLFKKPVILLGFILPNANIHSPNENFDEEMFWKGIEALEKIYSQ